MMAWLSSGRTNSDLAKKLAEFLLNIFLSLSPTDNGIISSPRVISAFRFVDRRHFLPDDVKARAYKDSPLRSQDVHLSAPHIYGSVLESLELQEGQSFLNVGSGSGYLSSLAGVLVGEHGTNHGIEINPRLVDFATACQAQICCLLKKKEKQRHASSSDGLKQPLQSRCSRRRSSQSEVGRESEEAQVPMDLDSEEDSELEEPDQEENQLHTYSDSEEEFEEGSDWDIDIEREMASEEEEQYKPWNLDEHLGSYCPPEFKTGDAFSIDVKTNRKYDRIYVGAGAPVSYLAYIRELLKPGGIVIGPFGDILMKVRCQGEGIYSSEPLACVQFFPLVSGGASLKEERPKVCYFKEPVWSWRTHQQFPALFRRGAFSLLLCSNREESALALLPRALVLNIISFMSSDWFEPPLDPEEKLRYQLEEAAAKKSEELRLERAEAERDSFRAILFTQQQRIHRVMARLQNLHRERLLAAASAVTVAAVGGEATREAAGEGESAREELRRQEEVEPSTSPAAAAF